MELELFLISVLDNCIIIKDWMQGPTDFLFTEFHSVFEFSSLLGQQLLVNFL